MPESMVSKPNNSTQQSRARQVTFVPQAMGIAVPLVIIAAFAAGMARQEPALMLAGAAFLVLWAYSLCMTLLLAVIHRHRSRRVSVHIASGGTAVGETAEAVYSESGAAVPVKRLAQLPGILVRCRLRLAAKDGRRITVDFNPADSTTYTFIADQRGAYFSDYDELVIGDMLGFFRFAFRLPVDDNVRLLVYPCAAEEAPRVRAMAGESPLTPEFSPRRTDNLIDHRPYVAGDDPRRINWKLYGHGGGLFIREGEREPPPRSNIVILIDTAYDPLLYSVEEARRAVDLLCENALAAARTCTESGMEALTGYSGGVIRGMQAAEPAAALAWPAAMPLSAAGDLPAAPAGCGILILALPRSNAETASLDRYLRTINDSVRTVDLLFLYGNNECLDAAETCVALYNRRPGVRARTAGVVI